MRRILALVATLALGAVVTAEATSKKVVPKKEETPAPVEEKALELSQPKPPQTHDRAFRCYELGRLYGASLLGMDESWRNRVSIFENYCRREKDPNLRRVPTDVDVNSLANEISALLANKGNKAYIEHKPLDDQLRTGTKAEGDLLNELLK